MSLSASTQNWSLDSRSPSPLDALSSEARERLCEILDAYLQALRQGLPPATERLIAEHPELAPVLELYLSNLQQLHGAAAAFGEATDDEPQPHDDALRLGDFLLLGEIGRGGMGVVYEARQISLSRRVALKVLPFASVLDAAQIVRFKNEAQSAAQLHHPHIVPVYAVGCEHGVHFYAMQFIEGQPLDRVIHALRLLAGKGPQADSGNTATAGAGETIALSSFSAGPATSCLAESWPRPAEYFRAVMQLGIEAADALHAAHSYGIVHRDIKPSNLLLDGDGKLWVTDFGLARCQTDAALTQTGHVVGTRQYMSPEQAQGQAALVDPRTDVYALGATLYELLTLEPALPKHLALPNFLYDHWQPVRPRQIESSIPRDLETVVLKALATERDERYLSAADLAADLRRALAGDPIVARPPTLLDRAGRWGRRHRRAVAAAIAVGAVALVGSGVALGLIQREKVLTERNYQRAEQNFRQAQQAVDRLGTQLAERLADVPGAEAVRRDLLEQTGDYYQQFIAQAGDDPALQAELALTYSKLGGVHRQMGATAEAIAAEEHALAVLRRLAAQAPLSLAYHGRLAVRLNNLALQLGSAGRTDEARQALSEAIALETERIQQGVDVPAARLALALSHNNRGDLERQVGQQDQARASFSAAIEIEQQLLAGDRQNPEILRQLAASSSNLAALDEATSPQVLELQRKAVDYQRQALAARPADTKYQGDLARALNNLGAAEARAGDDRAAVGVYRQAIQLQTTLLQAAPLDAAHRREIAVSYNNLGLCCTRLHQSAEAERCFRSALDFQEPLLVDSPHDAELCSTLGGIYNNLGFVLEGLKRFDDAGASYQRAVDRQQAAHRQAPHVERYREFLSKHYFNRGRVLRRLGYADQAAQMALERKTLWPSDSQRLVSVAEELAVAAQLLQDQPQPGMSAQRCAELAIDTLREAVAAGPIEPDKLRLNAAFASIQSHPKFAALLQQ